MKFIDVNCMVGEWSQEDLHFKTAEGLTCEMDRLNIEKALVFDSRAWLYDPVSGNNCLVNGIKGYDSLVPVIVLTPLIKNEFGGEEELKRFIRDNGVGAVRLFPMDQNYTLNLWNVEKLFSLLNSLRMPVMIECRGMYGGIDPYYPSIYEIARTFADVPIILTAVGYRSLRVLYELFERCPNLHVDTSTFITFHGIEDVVKNFGSRRILFGSRMPFIDGGVSVGRIIYADIPESDKENIAGLNIQRMLDNINMPDGKEGAVV